MALSKYAEKLYAWFGLYKITPAEYNTHLLQHPKTSRRGAFNEAFSELLTVYGS